MYYGYEDFEEEKQTKTYAIKDIRLLYKVADANLLEYLVKVGTDHQNSNRRVWIIQLNHYTQDVINSFFMSSNKIKKQKKDGDFTNEANNSFKSINKNG